MAYWKFIKPEQLAAWDRLRTDEKLMRAEGAALAEKLNAKPVFTNDVSRSVFYGVEFDNGFYVAKELWTRPTSNTGFASWPKARAPKGLSEEHKALLVIWNEHYPKTKVENDQFYMSIGLDWGMLFLTGITYFRFGDAIYVKTGAKPNEAAQAIEILGSEFDSAKREYVDAAS